jgi:hypothetical protein
MELQKYRENVTRTYENGKAVDRVDSISYRIYDTNGTQLGEAFAGTASYSINLNGGATDIAAATETIERLLGSKVSETSEE